MSIKEWVFTTDHKRVGILYLVGSLAAFAVAGIMALLMRAELSALGPTITSNPTTYNVWLYAHGAVMILGFQIPALTGFFANYCVPLMIGAKDVAFPRVNALSVWLFYVGIILALLTFVVPDPPDVMWTGYPPYSTITTGNTALYTFTVLVLGFASIIGGVNFLTTVAYMRAPGLKWTNLNIFVWCILGAFVLQLIFVPVLGTAVTLISFDKYLGTNFFDPTKGGDVLTYQNLFWFYSHPAVYVIFLPFIGVIYEIFAIFAVVYYWFPQLTGRMYNEFWGKLGFWITFVGTNIVFWTMMDIGVKGMPRRYFDYAQFPQFEGAHQLMTIGAVILGIGFVIAVVNWIVGALRGPPAGDNPWGSKSLEWTTVSPPPHGNWPSPPSLPEGWSPYAYGKR